MFTAETHMFNDYTRNLFLLQEIVSGQCFRQGQNCYPQELTLTIGWTEGVTSKLPALLLYRLRFLTGENAVEREVDIVV